MNYVVRFLLAGDDDELRLGNLLGDYVKGRVERYEHPGVTDRLRTADFDEFLPELRVRCAEFLAEREAG